MKAPRPWKLLVIVDGPEKAGKSTTLAQLEANLTGYGIKVARRKWTGPAKPDETEYLIAAAEWLGADTRETVMLWDRGWPSEYVYGTLLNQPRRMARCLLGPLWEGFVDEHALKIILMGPTLRDMEEHRSDDDLPVKPSSERQLYAAYGGFNNWHVLHNTWAPDAYARDVRDMTSSILESLSSRTPMLRMTRPHAYWETP